MQANGQFPLVPAVAVSSLRDEAEIQHTWPKCTDTYRWLAGQPSISRRDARRRAPSTSRNEATCALRQNEFQNFLAGYSHGSARLSLAAHCLISTWSESYSDRRPLSRNRPAVPGRLFQEVDIRSVNHSRFLHLFAQIR